MANTEFNPEEFRDSIATVAQDGSRIWIYPKKPAGKYYNLRTYTSWFLLALLFGMPFIEINDEPFMLFNVLERKFILFGIVFTPQDLHLFALAMITLMIFIVLFTVVFGRLFCGWVCPQTIFMEMVFRKIEYLIEGDASAQRRLNKASWTTEKFFKKLLKHVIFFSIAVLIANTFLAWIVGIDEVQKIVTEPISMHVSGFIAMLVFSVLFYGVFAFFREQVCIAVCPYGRLQGVLLVKDSVVVIYDWLRGEPRGKIRKKKNPSKTIDLPIAVKPEEPDLGDCIDCHLCVKVCPTGIDIRNGTQLECINCTACMDACDEVMRKIDRPEGLIRYDSYNNIEKGTQKIFTSRVWAYSAALALLIILQGFLFMNRSDLEVLILRTPGMLFQRVDDHHISNLYNYQIINKTKENISDISFRLTESQGKIKLVGQIQDVEELGFTKGSMFIEMPEDVLQGRKNTLRIEVYSGERQIDVVRTNFLGPPK